MKLVAFELSMPCAASWNGKWSGDGRPYVRVCRFTKDMIEEHNLEALLEHRVFDYRWADGWCAAVTLREVDSKEAQKLRKKSVGFYGYDWMIDSILDVGFIKKPERSK